MNNTRILAFLAIAGSLFCPGKSYAEELKYKKFEKTAAEEFCYKLAENANQANYTKSTYDYCQKILEQYQARIEAAKPKTMACVDEYYARSGTLGRISLDCMDYIEVIKQSYNAR